MIKHKFVDPASQQQYTLTKHDTFISVSFLAMSCRCELLLDTKDIFIVHTLAKICLSEIKRIINKFSRYVPGNICHQINNSHGKPVSIDEESATLLSHGDACFKLSEGLIDLTTGVLRKVWFFDGSDNVPDQSKIDALLPFVGWDKITLSHSEITLPENMELDFGAVAKEYAVESLCKLASIYIRDISVVINLGGDIQITKPRDDGSPWFIGVETTEDVIALKQGALSTSAMYKQYLTKNGMHYSHILSPKTGWPIQFAPQVISVHSPHCIRSGMLATTALLKADKAIRFLEGQNVQYWIKT